MKNMVMTRKEKKGFFILLGIILSILLFNSLSHDEKDEKPPLNGIFALKLGMTENDLKKVVDLSLLKEIEFKNPLWCGKAIEEKKLKVFYLSYYVVDENYRIEDITLSFSEDKLYTISISKYNFRTEELLTQKYGTPKVVSDKMSETHEQLRVIKKEWDTNIFNNVCMSIEKNNSRDSLVEYNLMIVEQNKKRQAHESVKRYWNNLQQDIQKIKEDLNQPLIDKL